MIDRLAAQLEGLRYLGDAFPKWVPYFGPGVIAAFLGSPVDASTGTTWFHPSGLTSLAETDLLYTTDNLWWQRVEAITRAGVARWGNRVVVGHTDLGGNLDILASLRGTQQLLLDLYDAPDEVERLGGQITPLWQRYYDEFHRLVAATNRGTASWAPLWAPGRGYMLQSDFSYMISPRMFERLILPDLTACCDALDYAFYHLDGKGEIKHLDMLLSIERLRGIQWIPGDGAPPAEEWLPLAQAHPRRRQALPGLRDARRRAQDRPRAGRQGLRLLYRQRRLPDSRRCAGMLRCDARRRPAGLRWSGASRVTRTLDRS